MTDRRIIVWLCGLFAAMAILVGRLVQLQVLRADEFRARTEAMLLDEPQSLPFIRGSICDRRGRVLVHDEPCWEVQVDYAAITLDPAYVGRMTRRYLKSQRYPEASDTKEMEQAFREEVAASWEEIVQFASTPDAERAEVFRDPQATVRRVSAIRAIVSERWGFDREILEERIPHTVISGLTSNRQIVAKERFSRFPWIHITPSTRRGFFDSLEPFAHVLGRMGHVDAGDVDSDPHSDDPFRCYRSDDQKGVSGVEAAMEQRLRGRRGQFRTDRDGTPLTEFDVEPEYGRDVSLTIHADLQRRLYDLLGREIESIPYGTGGVVVVVDVQSREVLALVSYPSYDPGRFEETYAALRDDTVRQPLRFRAVGNRYAPGSIVKPLVCWAGLVHHAIDLTTTETCDGYLFPDVHDRWRCWEVHGTGQRMAHGPVEVVAALRGSCNVFMWRVAEHLGIDALCDAFDAAGIGRTTGLGLPEENHGINPTPGWLAQNRNQPVTAGVVRNFAIGQGELAMTPAQVANLAAVYANGRYRPLTLIRGRDASPEWTLPGSPEVWRAIRQGIFDVTNHPDGTAYKYAHVQRDGYALAGKTGSATTAPWPTSYRVSFRNPADDQDGTSVGAAGDLNRTVIVPAGSASDAIDRITRTYPRATINPEDVDVAGRWPEQPSADGDKHAHAWFGGYLQPVTPSGAPDWSQEPRVAFSVLVEFGGSGGRVAGPAARRVADVILDILGPQLDPDHDPKPSLQP